MPPEAKPSVSADLGHLNRSPCFLLAAVSMVLQRRKAQWIMVARYLLLSTDQVNNEAFIQLFLSGTDFNVDVMSTPGLTFYY